MFEIDDGVCDRARVVCEVPMHSDVEQHHKEGPPIFVPLIIVAAFACLIFVPTRRK